MSEFGNVGTVVGQGTMGGSLISQAVLSDGVSEHFTPGGPDEVEYGTVPLAPFMYMDDLIHGVPGIAQARQSNSKVDKIMKERCWSLNREKTVYLIIGSSKQKQALRKQLEVEPLLCGEFITEEKEHEKWLGQYLSGGGLSDSVAKTVDAREEKIRGACLEVAQIVNDWRARVTGGMESALFLWEACVVPSLMYGSGTWVEMNSNTVKKLNNLQNWFIRLILQIGPGAPVASLCWETGFLDMEIRAWRDLIMMVIDLRNMEANTLARQVYEVQKNRHWSGLAKETAKICALLQIEDCNVTLIPKKYYWAIVTRACHYLNEERLRKMAENKEKCVRILVMFMEGNNILIIITFIRSDSILKHVSE